MGNGGNYLGLSSYSQVVVILVMLVGVARNSSFNNHKKKKKKKKMKGDWDLLASALLIIEIHIYQYRKCIYIFDTLFFHSSSSSPSPCFNKA